MYTSMQKLTMNLDQTLTLEDHDDRVNDLWNGILPQVDGQISIGRSLVIGINPWYVLDLSIPCPLVESSSVDLLTVFKRSSDVNKEVVSSRSSDCLLQLLSGGSGRSDRSSDNGSTGFR
jgi:hypothetical protein